MLPIIDIKADEICETGHNFTSGRVEAIGSIFHFDWTKVTQAAKEKQINLDRFLTFRFASFFAKSKFKSKVLIYYRPVQNGFALACCSKRNLNFFGVLHSNSGMPGYTGYGEDYLQPGSTPFFYYDGFKQYRLYRLSEEPESEYYICDFGNLYGMQVEESFPEDYDRILEDPVNHVEYSAVPKKINETLRIQGVSVILHHAFYR